MGSNVYVYGEAGRGAVKQNARAAEQNALAREKRRDAAARRLVLLEVGARRKTLTSVERVAMVRLRRCFPAVEISDGGAR